MKSNKNLTIWTFEFVVISLSKHPQGTANSFIVEFYGRVQYPMSNSQKILLQWSLTQE